MPITGNGWELHIQRQSVQGRGGRFRTVGNYAIYHDGQAQAGLSGTSVETKGPGDNATAGNGHRVEAGPYPLGTHAGPHYATIGYIVSNDPDQTPKPGLLLLKTEHRFDILVHPGHGFLASVGCINLTDPSQTDPTMFLSWTAETESSSRSMSCEGTAEVASLTTMGRRSLTRRSSSMGSLSHGPPAPSSRPDRRSCGSAVCERRLRPAETAQRPAHRSRLCQPVWGLRRARLL